MASVSFKTLMDASALPVATTNGDKKAVEPRQTDFIVVATTANAVGATVDVTIQHSTDGSTWHDLVTVPSIAGNGEEIAFVTTGVLPAIRAQAAVVGATADLEVRLYHDKAH